ncbi:MAG: stage V sporulation protein S [Olegusella sp.]|nr:stage V sporulation protein S [Olegusella sp.]
MDFLKVSSKSQPSSVAGAIAGMVKDGVPCTMQAVGAGAVNQAIKAVAIARGFLIPTGVDISCSPTFADINIGGESRTALRIRINVQKISVSSSSVPVTEQVDVRQVSV